jgi:hypothetical protein
MATANNRYRTIHTATGLTLSPNETQAVLNVLLTDGSGFEARVMNEEVYRVIEALADAGFRYTQTTEHLQEEDEG